MAVKGLRFRIPTRYRIVWVALALLLVFVQIESPATLGLTSLRLTTALAGVLCVASLGQMLVVMTGGLDITVASVMTLSGAIVVRETQGANDKFVQAALIALVIGGAIGLIDGLLTVVLRLNALVATLAMSGIVTGSLLVWSGVTFSKNGEVPPVLSHFAARSWGPVSSLALFAVGVGIVVSLVLRSTRLGRQFVAVGANPVAARILGIRVTAYRVGAFSVGGVLYALAGLLLAGQLRTPDYTLGSPYLLLTFVAVVLGGAALSGGPASVLCVGASCMFLATLNEFLAVRGVGGGAATLLQGVVLVIAVGAISLSGTVRSVLARVFRPRPSRPAPSGMDATREDDGGSNTSGSPTPIGSAKEA